LKKKNAFLVQDVLVNPGNYLLYGTGSLEHYEKNKILFSKAIRFVDPKEFLDGNIPNFSNTVVIVFTPFDEKSLSDLFLKDYQYIELFEFIDYKAKIFWDQKGEYKGVDRNHYMSNETVLSELDKNISMLDLVPKDKDLTILSLGCGTGNLERELLKLSNVKRIDAYDISAESLQVAKQKLSSHPREKFVNYFEANLNEQAFKHVEYDLVVAQECIHHIQNLESLYANISSSLKSGGVFLQYEYVGPNRFQFEDYIISLINSVLDLLPQRYKIREKYIKTTLYDIIQADPSEAVRAQDIVPFTQKFFPKTHIYNYSGTFMHILHQNLNMDYFYTENRKPVRNYVRSKLLTKLVFCVEKIVLRNRYSHMALLQSFKGERPS
jgi:2-polyprenyl-3-methyl-5-hydroxy-6-metoxy-1,4-benzoquinol methylase